MTRREFRFTFLRMSADGCAEIRNFASDHAHSFFDIRKLRARFRRWSRTNYAMFASLGREVLIGHLSTDVADASLRKLKKRLQLTPPYMLRADRCTAMPDDPPPEDPEPCLKPPFSKLTHTSDMPQRCHAARGYARFMGMPLYQIIRKEAQRAGTTALFWLRPADHSIWKRGKRS